MGRKRKTWTPATKPSERTIRRVAGYVRVSTQEQAAEGYGLEAQRQALADYCRAAEYELVNVYADEGLSGTAPIGERPGLAALLDAARSGLIDAVVTKSSDRIGRRVAVAFAVYDALDAAGVRFLSITEPELSSALLRAIFAGIAAEERQRIIERTSSGRRVKAAQGGYAGGRVPYGYVQVGARKDARWDVDPDAAAVVRRIFADRAAGKPYAAIAAGLDQDGIPAPRGGQWTPRAVHTIANNPAYTGVRRWREGQEYVAEGEHPAIISSALFRDGTAA